MYTRVQVLPSYLRQGVCVGVSVACNKNNLNHAKTRQKDKNPFYTKTQAKF